MTDRLFYRPKYRSEYLSFLTKYIAPEILKKLGMRDLIKRYYAIQYRLQKG